MKIFYELYEIIFTEKFKYFPYFRNLSSVFPIFLTWVFGVKMNYFYKFIDWHFTIVTTVVCTWCRFLFPIAQNDFHHRVVQKLFKAPGRENCLQKYHFLFEMLSKQQRWFFCFTFLLLKSSTWETFFLILLKQVLHHLFYIITWYVFQHSFSQILSLSCLSKVGQKKSNLIRTLLICVWKGN